MDQSSRKELQVEIDNEERKMGLSDFRKGIGCFFGSLSSVVTNIQMLMLFFPPTLYVGAKKASFTMNDKAPFSLRPAKRTNIDSYAAFRSAAAWPLRL